MAFKYLSWLLYPLFGCYAVYSLLYVEHKGWYSWVLSMLYGFLLTFGKYILLHLNRRTLMPGADVECYTCGIRHISRIKAVVI